MAGYVWGIGNANECLLTGWQTVLITGGSQGMGRSVSRILASKGANVLIVARGVEKLKDTVAYISVITMTDVWKLLLTIAADSCYTSFAEISLH